MPGTNNNEDAKADFLTDWALYATTFTGGTPVLPADAAIAADFTKSVTAARNRILVVPRKVSGAGAGKCKLNLYAKLAGGSLASVWVLVDKTTVHGDPDVLVRFNNLPAGIYAVIADPETSGDVVALHLAHNENTGIL